MTGKRGYTRAGEYPTVEQAKRRAELLHGKFQDVEVREGTKGKAFFKPEKFTVSG